MGSRGVPGHQVSLAILPFILERPRAHTGVCLCHRGYMWRVSPYCSHFTSGPQKVASSSRTACVQSPKPSIYLSFSDAFPPTLTISFTVVWTELCRAGVGEKLSKDMMHVNCFVICDLTTQTWFVVSGVGVWLRDVAKSERKKSLAGGGVKAVGRRARVAMGLR